MVRALAAPGEGFSLNPVPVRMKFQLDPLPTPDSFLLHLDARWKLAALVLAAAAVALLHHLLSGALALAGSLALALLARLPWRWFVTRLGAVAGFLGVVLILLPALAQGISWLNVQPALHGLELGALVCSKALAMITLTMVLLAASPLSDLLKAAHSLRVPGLVIQLATLTYRYAFVLSGELARLRVALRVRGYRNRATRHSYRTVGHVAGTLLVRAYERAERVGQAMRCRGFDGRFRTLGEFRTRAADVAFFCLLVTSSAALALWDFVR